ncbi:O-antigen ligase family protein [Cereibacter azotoformans]|uniref:Polysaccharide deacetylase n=1 Tax=Cereibacter sphaeroides (strain ATCC 17025 / ATH 2.4.3) TaxID=349102 RepID=A4WY14_CERS5|nr:O-antigen ligase family protein [Cereibacter azotoformans]ULB11727.1 O-antigen ligase family protein [Cereibacter azotoformans]
MTRLRHIGESLTIITTSAFAGLATLVAALAASPVLAIGVPVALLGGVVLLSYPFWGLGVLVFFSHLDSIEKLIFGFLPLSFFKALTAATLVVTVLTAAQRRPWIAAVLRDPVVAAALIFGALGVVSFLLAAERAVALTEMRKLASLQVLLLLIVVLVDTPRKAGVIAWILIVSSLVSALILMADTVLGTHLVAASEAATTAQSSEGFVRSSGASDQNPTTAASLLLVGVIMALVHAIETPRFRLLMLGVAGLGTIALIFSFARSAAIAYAIVGICLAWRYRRSRYTPLAMFGVLVAAVGALPFIPAEYWERMATIFGGGGDWTLGRRLSYNLIGIQLFAERPVFGIGPGNFAERFNDPEFRFYPGRTLLGRELHNMYLSVLTQYGVVGAAAFYGMLGGALVALRRVLRAPASETLRIWALALGFGYSAYLIASLFLPNEYTKYTWILCGLCAALHRVNEKERQE